jgi:hypothetical protein
MGADNTRHGVAVCDADPDKTEILGTQDQFFGF